MENLFGNDPIEAYVSYVITKVYCCNTADKFKFIK